MTENRDFFYVKMRDGKSLPVFAYKSPHKTNATVILIHGITAEQNALQQLAQRLQPNVNVFIPILRGYGDQDGRGDISYFGQYDHDLIDVAKSVNNQGYDRIFWAGHSMGCANLLRLLENNLVKSEGFLFLSPFFHPSLKLYKYQGRQETKQEDLYKLKLFKIISLATLMKVGVYSWTNSKVAIVPDEFTENNSLHLSFRLLLSRFIENAKQIHLSKANAPLLTLIGSNDEVTDASKLQAWWEKQTSHQCTIVQDEDHNTILHCDETIRNITNWLKKSIQLDHKHTVT
ncbi:alpha/beta hydrolase [Pontibacillus yanchengensis]|nr:alpha/beta fold hydrolase [Pontibacillus yanchengensis]